MLLFRHETMTDLCLSSQLAVPPPSTVGGEGAQALSFQRFRETSLLLDRRFEFVSTHFISIFFFQTQKYGIFDA